jgi:uncharacterized protein Smg (DUF494 family)
MSRQIEKKVVEILLNVLHKIDLSYLTEDELEFIQDELQNKGYHQHDIRMVLNWIINHSPEMEEVSLESRQSPDHFRVLHEMEKTFLAPEAQGFLLELSHNGAITPQELEDILQRVVWLGQENLSLDDLREFLQVIFTITSLGEEQGGNGYYPGMLPESSTFH